MVKIYIDKVLVEVEEGMTVLQAAEYVGIRIPHFCFHHAFSPEGNCRMCLVEIEGLPKLELACSTQVREEMKIATKSERVVQARKAVLEFLLAEHPLDCPICDKAGDCKLQDYYEEYGLFKSQFEEFKEKRVKNIKIGKNLILDQERCIVCTRCVRFLREVTKTEELGVFNRGIHSEVNIYDGTLIDNKYSGNLAELCPVGAITDADFRFKTRSWFLSHGESICPLCSRGCNILIEYHPGFPRIPRTKRVYRIKSQTNHDVNGFWICDLGRYGYTYLDEGRLEQILSNNNQDSELNRDKVVMLIAEKIKRLYQMKKTSRIALIIHAGLSNEELFLAKKIFVGDLAVEKVYFADPPQGEADGFLLTADRSPNTRGAQEIGFDLKPVDTVSLAEGTDFLLVFGSSLTEYSSLTQIKDVLGKIETKVLFTSHSNELNPLFDIVFPAALTAEKQGTFTNVDGNVQKFSPVLESFGECLPEWEMLVDLAKECKINLSYYEQFTSPEAVMGEMRKEIPFFEKSSD